MNNQHNVNRINDVATDQNLVFPHPMFVNTSLQSGQQYQNTEQIQPDWQEDYTPSSYSTGQPLHLQTDGNPVWFEPKRYSNRSTSVQVGNELHQVFVYENKDAKTKLVEHALTNDCNFMTSERYYMYCTLDNRRFRSKGEVCIYFALKEKGHLFYANSSVTAGSVRKEPDFSIIYKGRVYVLDVLNNETHKSEEDALNVRFYQDYGVPIRSYSSEHCENYPQWVVQDFLYWVQQH